MSDLNRRLQRAVRAANAGGDLPWLTYKQDLDDFDLWHNCNGDDTKTTGELDALAATYNVMCITWAQDWRGADDHQTIRLTWGDDLDQL